MRVSMAHLETASTRGARRTALSIRARRTRRTLHARRAVLAGISTRSRLSGRAGLAVFTVLALPRRKPDENDSCVSRTDHDNNSIK